MTNLTEALFASLILHRRDRNANRPGRLVAENGVSEDLRAARERAKARR
jgi:hypothetical protein